MPLRAFADEKGIWRYQVRLEQVSPLYIEALLNYEDRYFYQHPGVNPVSMLRAGWQWLTTGKIISGGSTITMQVARILHPHERTFIGKAQQVLRALQLEWRLDKQAILELYINHAPFGGTIEGVQAASLQYLNKSADQLRHSEAALLAVLPQAPSRLRPDRHPQLAQTYRDKVLRRLAQFEIWSPKTIKHALEEQVAVWPLRTPVIAPLLSRRLRQESRASRVIASTIDRDLQLAFADAVKGYTAPLATEISAAALLIDNQSHEVLAYVGSADFYNSQRSGHVDMVKAIRSPGSTLKPVLFALSLDKSLIHSESLLADVPRFGTGYRPGNFSGGFSGPVSAAEALQRSLNLPFVQLIEAFGDQAFANKLMHVGAGLRIPEGEASSAIVLGGAGSSLEQLVKLYSAMANQGQVYPLQYTQADETNSGRALYSPEAAWITWDILRKLDRPFRHSRSFSYVQLPEFGWKTGTSWDYRDVWAIGVNQQYTLGVWLGRPDGKPMQRTMGRELAGPLLFNLLELLNHSNSTELAKPDRVKEAEICWPDGRAKEQVSVGCDESRIANTIGGVTPRTLANRPEERALFYDPMQHFLIEKASSLRVSRACATGSVSAKSVSLWPVAMESWLKADYQRAVKVPDYADNCKVTLNSKRKIRLAGVKEGQIYHSLRGSEISLKITAEGEVSDHEWYLNGELVQSGSNVLKLKLASKAQYELLVQNRSGATGRVSFQIL
ncbi:penicillin-binding protein [Oceanospirillum sp. MED92]|uniref:peptidoglycan glycosyltransferase n=1 Tax=Neptuniibacter caesariensis TaxID=207954 RepID=A0A7U8GRQ6_NEPCE|nr:penicillin-binding protein [Oceanospirillum sp. MED92] [Neptuniibacter caesariensis]